MAAKRTAGDWAVEAARHHTDLCLFETIISMIEGGGFSSASEVEQFNVISVCRRGAQKSLARHDRALRHLSSRADSKP